MGWWFACCDWLGASEADRGGRVGCMPGSLSLLVGTEQGRPVRSLAAAIAAFDPFLTPSPLGRNDPQTPFLAPVIKK